MSAMVELLVNPFCMADRDSQTVAQVCAAAGVKINWSTFEHRGQVRILTLRGANQNPSENSRYKTVA